MSIYTSANKYVLPLQQLLVREMSVLILTENFLQIGTPHSIKVNGEKVQSLGFKCIVRV